MSASTVTPSSPISIHALLAESDGNFRIQQQSDCYFYPRSPCGERHGTPSASHRSIQISIHALLAESDLITLRQSSHNQISIHALLAERDPRRQLHRPACADFYPRSPCEKRPTQGQKDFYPRSPCGERPFIPSNHVPLSSISIHALLAESDRQSWQAACTLTGFLSTLSLRRATGHSWGEL